MTTTVRTIEVHELADWVASMGAGFFHDIADGYAEYFAPEVDFDRTWAGIDDGQVVGTLRSFATELTVPGPAFVQAAALTNVTVSATHRRQGILTRMITADLEAAARRGEAVGILIASEYPIYGRFGYGPAVELATYKVNSSDVRFRRPSLGTVERVEAARMRQEAPEVYERFRASQPGAIQRSERWWDARLRIVDVPGDKDAKSQCLLYRSPAGEVEGYVLYTGKQNWESMRPQGTLELQELCSVTSRAYQRLWQHCCDVDLMTVIEAENRCVSEPLPFLLADGRAVQQKTRHDFVWVRVLDVESALAARSYGAAGRLVIEVDDPLGFGAGRFLLEAGPSGVQCSRSAAPADLSMPVDVLGSIFLGGTSIHALAEANRLDEHRPGGLAQASSMFGSLRPPWCTTWF
jgi:predicted acetyltransferase